MGDRIADPARGRPARPVRDARPSSSPARPTTSSPSSSAPTGRSSGWRSARSPTSTLVAPQRPAGQRPPACALRTNVRDALSVMLAAGGGPLTVVDEPTASPASSRSTCRSALCLADAASTARPAGAGRGRDRGRRELVIPNFGGGGTASCEQVNRLFCTDWVRQNWSGVLEPALGQHVVLVRSRSVSAS